MAFLAAHKDWASVEVTPHHLTLVAPDCYERLGTYAQMNPPVRDERHRDAIWAALGHGRRRRAGLRPRAAYARGKGPPLSRQPLRHDRRADAVPIMLDHVNAGRLTLERFVDLTSHGPQRLFGIRGKGRIAVGYDADFTVVDLKRRETITQRVDRIALRLDALRRAQASGLARRHVRARPPRHVGRRDSQAPARASCRLPRVSGGRGRFGLTRWLLRPGRRGRQPGQAVTACPWRRCRRDGRHVLVQHAEAARRCRPTDRLGVVGAVNAVERVAEVQRHGAERVSDAARHLLGQLPVARAHLIRRMPVGPGALRLMVSVPVQVKPSRPTEIG